jgi:hypothetical protein
MNKLGRNPFESKRQELPKTKRKESCPCFGKTVRFMAVDLPTKGVVFALKTAILAHAIVDMAIFSRIRH